MSIQDLEIQETEARQKYKEAQRHYRERELAGCDAFETMDNHKRMEDCEKEWAEIHQQVLEVRFG